VTKAFGTNYSPSSGVNPFLLLGGTRPRPAPPPEPARDARLRWFVDQDDHFDFAAISSNEGGRQSYRGPPGPREGGAERLTPPAASPGTIAVRSSDALIVREPRPAKRRWRSIAFISLMMISVPTITRYKDLLQRPRPDIASQASGAHEQTEVAPTQLQHERRSTSEPTPVGWRNHGQPIVVGLPPDPVSGPQGLSPSKHVTTHSVARSEQSGLAEQIKDAVRKGMTDFDPLLRAEPDKPQSAKHEIEPLSLAETTEIAEHLPAGASFETAIGGDLAVGGPETSEYDPLSPEPRPPEPLIPNPDQSLFLPEAAHGKRSGDVPKPETAAATQGPSFDEAPGLQASGEVSSRVLAQPEAGVPLSAVADPVSAVTIVPPEHAVSRRAGKESERTAPTLRPPGTDWTSAHGKSSPLADERAPVVSQQRLTPPTDPEPDGSLLIARANELLSFGDISGAELFLKRARELEVPAIEPELARAVTRLEALRRSGFVPTRSPGRSEKRRVSVERTPASR
jgi:hypothetical protein